MLNKFSLTKLAVRWRYLAGEIICVLQKSLQAQNIRLRNFAGEIIILQGDVFIPTLLETVKIFSH